MDSSVTAHASSSAQFGYCEHFVPWQRTQAARTNSQKACLIRIGFLCRPKRDWVRMKGKERLGFYEGKRRTERLGFYAEWLGSYDGRWGSYAETHRGSSRVRPGLTRSLCPYIDMRTMVFLRSSSFFPFFFGGRLPNLLEVVFHFFLEVEYF